MDRRSRTDVSPSTRGFSLRHEFQSHAIHAVAQASRRRAIVENMAEMPATAAAMHLSACHEKLAIHAGADRTVDRLRETRPASAAVKLGLRREQRQIASGAVVSPGCIVLVERTREGILGPVLAQNMVLLRREDLLPLLVRLGDLEGFLLGLAGREAAGG